MPRILWIALLSATVAESALSQKAAVPKQPDIVVLGQQNVTELLCLMDTDKNGKISKQEWMKFMEIEFDKLDKNKTGQLDQKELLQSRVLVKQVRHSDLGK